MTGPSIEDALINGSAEQPGRRRAAQAALRFLRTPVALAELKAAPATVVEPAGAAQ